APTQGYTLSLHDALPISHERGPRRAPGARPGPGNNNEGTFESAFEVDRASGGVYPRRLRTSGINPAARRTSLNRELRPGLSRRRSEEHTSELQSRSDLVC